MKQIHHIVRRWCLVFLLMCTTAVAAQAQETKTFKGVIEDASGNPVVGATIVVPGTTTGTMSDVNGNFSLNVPAGSTVEISYVGYISQRISNFATTKVVLEEDTQNIEDVVVVGYGSQKKAHLTGSVATIPTEDIVDLSAGGLASTLGGLVNGLSVSGGDGRPGENATIRIRDTNKLGDIGVTAQSPLYVIDGYIYPNDVRIGDTTRNLGEEAFNNLDPQTVENISVLKDASAAVYGARAANGVILVTTKKGRQGAPQISYSGTFGFTDAVKIPSMLNAYQYGKLYNAVAAADPTNTSLNHKTDLFQADELRAMQGLNYNLIDKYWKTGFTHQHSLNISGATEKASYFGGISYFNQDGNLGHLDYNRWNYRAGLDVKLTKWLKANLTVSGDYGEKNTPNVKIGGSNIENEFRQLLTRPQYIPEFVEGLPIAARGISNNELSYLQNYNYAVLQNNGDYSETMTSNLTINGRVEVNFDWFKPLRGLNLSFNYAKSIYNEKGNQYASDFELYYFNERMGSGNHLYTPVAGSDYEAFIAEDNLVKMKLKNGNSANASSYISRDMSRADNYQVNFTASYAREFGKHAVSALFSVERSEAESEYLKGQRNDPYSFTTGQSNSATGTLDTRFTRAESGSLSYIGRVNYAYDNKYLFEFLVRSDASTKFAPENYWGTFPSASVGWVLSQENWLKNSKAVDFLKIRGSFGLTGRDNTAAWQWMQIYAMDSNKGPQFGISGDGTENRITINKNNSAVNRNVHWDKSYKGNIGIDFNTLRNRLSVTVDAYKVWNREMLMNIKQSIPTTVGTQSAAVNMGEMNSWGLEFSATWRDKIGKDFKYRIGLQTGYSDNSVLNMDWVTEYLYRQITPGSRSDLGTWGMECIGMFRSFQDVEEYFDRYNITSYMGMTKDQVRPGMLIYKDIRGVQQEDGTYGLPDGIVDEKNDQVHLSNRSNPYHITTNLNAEWKGLSITAQIRASWGGYSFIPTNALKPETNIEMNNMPSFWDPDKMFVYADVLDAEGNVTVAENRDGSLPNLNYATGEYKNVNSVNSTFWRVSGTRVTLNRLTLAYTIPSKYTKKIGIASCRINITGQNLLSFYNPYPDNFMDPLSGSFNSYPSLRKFTVGVNLTF